MHTPISGIAVIAAKVPMHVEIQKPFLPGPSHRRGRREVTKFVAAQAANVGAAKSVNTVVSQSLWDNALKRPCVQIAPPIKQRNGTKKPVTNRIRFSCRLDREALHTHAISIHDARCV